MSKFNASHIAIPTILKVEPDALDQIGAYLGGCSFQKVVIYFGNGLIDMFGYKVLESLRDAHIEVLEYCELDTVNINDIINLAFGLPNATQAVIGLGGGKVIDAAKYIGFLRKLPFISVPTSASSDGFSSASASLIVNLPQKFRSRASGIWHYCGYHGHQKRPAKVSVLRHRGHGVKNHRALRLEI